MKKEGIKEETKNKKSLILIILCGVLLIAAIVFLVMYLAKPKYEIKITIKPNTLQIFTIG